MGFHRSQRFDETLSLERVGKSPPRCREQALHGGPVPQMRRLRRRGANTAGLVALCLALFAAEPVAAQSGAPLVRQGVAALELGNPQAMEKARGFYEEALRVDGANYEAAWRLAEVYYYLWEAAAGWESGEGAKRKVLLDLSRQGVNAGRLAQHIKPEGVEGLFWLSANLGIWGLTNGVLDSLAQVGSILQYTERCIELDPEGVFERGGCYRVAASVYSRVPGFPISVGDRRKAQRYFEASMKRGGDYGINFNLWAEHYLATGNIDEAVATLEKGMAIMQRRGEKTYFDRRDGQRARELLKQAQARRG
jgi:tetratricopeptide (TPR) repeat protein